MSVPTIIISPAAAKALPGIDKHKLAPNVTKLRKIPILRSCYRDNITTNMSLPGFVITILDLLFIFLRLVFQLNNKSIRLCLSSVTTSSSSESLTNFEMISSLRSAVPLNVHICHCYV